MSFPDLEIRNVHRLGVTPLSSVNLSPLKKRSIIPPLLIGTLKSLATFPWGSERRVNGSFSAFLNKERSVSYTHLTLPTSDLV